MARQYMIVKKEVSNIWKRWIGVKKLWKYRQQKIKNIVQKNENFDFFYLVYCSRYDDGIAVCRILRATKASKVCYGIED
jgi:hypothetical protein